VIIMIVIKIGGSVVKGNLDAFFEELKNICLKEKAVLVHGGGRYIDEIAKQMNLEQKYVVSVSGFRSRYTDKRTLDLIKMVFAGKINKEIVAHLNSIGIKAIGLSGVDAELILAERKKRLKIIDERGRKVFIDGNYSGKPIKVNVNLLNTLLNLNLLPVIAPIGISRRSEILNLDGDRVAARIAGELSSRLVILTDVNGVYLKGKLIKKLALDEIEGYIQAVEGGMKKKLLACKEAIELGVKEAVIATIHRDRPIRSALNHLNCTVVSKDA